MKRGEVLLVVGLVFFMLVSLVSVRITSALTTFPAGTTCADFHDTISDDLFVHGINNEHYELEGDIDCSGYTFTPIGSVSGLNFGGILDGKSHVIRNLRINRPSENYIGLFRKMSSGEIKNLGLENVDIEGNQFVGGFSGYTGGIGTIINNSHVTGTIKGSAWVGGFSGTEVYVSWSYSNVNVEGGAWTGGLIGTGGTVENSYARGSVTGSSHCGGLIGVSGNIKYSYSTGSVSCGSYPGGLIGSFGSPTCLASFWDTQTSGQSGSGCGLGKTTTLMKTESTFTDAGWDFTNIWDIDSTNDGYPHLRPYSETPSGCPSGMTNYWTFDNADVSGNIVKDIVGGKDGTNNGATSTSGKVNQAFDFSTDYVSLPTSNSIITNPSSWTIVSWFNADTISSDAEEKGNRVFTIHRGTGTRTAISLMLGENNKVKLNYCERNGDGGTPCGGAYGENIYNIADVSTGNWYFYATTYDGTSIKTYINGELKQTNTDSPVFPSLANAMIGRGEDSGIFYFDGKIDEVAIFNRPLTAAEVSELYAKSGYCEAATTPTCTDGLRNGDETGVDCGGSCPACVVPTLPCTANDLIMKLFKPSNSHGALWNQSYDYNICCSKIFGAGNPACSVTNPHDCKTAGSNKIVELFQQNNSNAQIPDGPLSYPFDVCYGNFVCEARNNICNYNEEMIVALYQNNNSHITDPSYTPDGMISWWRMDEGAAGTDISYDFLQRNNLSTGESTLVTGKIGKAVSFNGVDEYGEVEDDASLRLTKFTTEAWFKLDSLPADGDAFSILAKGENITDGHSNYIIEVFRNSTGGWGGGAELACGFEDHSDKNYRLIYTIDNSYIRRFVHVACTLDGDNWKMYIDGEEVSTKVYMNYNLIASLSGAIPATSSAPFYIGAMFGASVDGLGSDEVSAFFPGIIDDAAIYNRALTPEEIQHRYNMGMYEKKICCKSGVGNVYWTNRMGEPISKAQVNDTVLMIYQGTSSEHNFSIYERDFVDDDNIRTGNDAVPTFMLTDGKAIAKWKITDADLKNSVKESDELDDKGVEFYFRVDGKQSADLNVSIIPNNSEPYAIINYPNLSLRLEDRRFRLGRGVSFNQTCGDEDDDLLITWYLDNETKINCTIDENCNITHAYTMWGTKDVILEAKETGREIPKKAEDRTQVFIYNNSINVFALITEPPFNKTFNSSESIAGIRFNASKSWVANCTTSVTSLCGQHGEACYDVDGLRCYDFNKTGAYGIGTSSPKYDLWFDWSFEDGVRLNGNWTGHYGDVVDFEKYFSEPTKHRADLKVGYDPK